ncbi:hypothetical protein Esti_004719 [Eimeria stiedai]
MIAYAVADVRYLLNLYFVFGRKFAKLEPEEVELYERELKAVFPRSYNFPHYDLEGEAMQLSRGLPKEVGENGLELMKLILSWRDIRARSFDVGRHCVVPRDQLCPVVEGVSCCGQVLLF